MGYTHYLAGMRAAAGRDRGRQEDHRCTPFTICGLPVLNEAEGIRRKGCEEIRLRPFSGVFTCSRY